MQAILGAFLSLVLIALCASVLRLVARERDPWLLVAGSVMMALQLLILWPALMMHLIGPGTALGLLGLAASLGLVVVLRRCSFVPLDDTQGGLKVLLAGLPGLLLVGYFALSLEGIFFGLSDGFVVHSSNIGYLAAGRYPLIGLLGEPYQGHFGRDMLTAMLAVAFDGDFLEVDWMVTCFIQVLHFFFFLHWFRVEGQGTSYALLGAHFAFFGSAFADRIGLVDTMDNNNAVAYMSVTFCSYLILRWYREGNRGAAVLAGVFLGLAALIYEINFGLLGLSLFTITLLKKARYRGFLVLVMVALAVAVVEGGVVTQMAKKAVWGRAQHQLDPDKAWHSQNVEIRFPKEDLFVLRRDNLRPSRYFETKLRPVSADFTHSRESASLFSKPILTTLWYPVWLAPLVFIGIWRTRHLLAGWFFIYGFYSLLTPSLVSFGFWDVETARWLFNAAFGFSVAFALMLARALHAPKPWKYGAWVLVAAAVWFHLPGVAMELGEIVAVQKDSSARMPSGPGAVPGVGLLPKPRASLAYHYGFDESDWKAAEALREMAAEDGADFLNEKFLVNYRPEALPPQGNEIASGPLINITGLRASLCGLLPAGLTGPPANAWCSPLAAESLASRAFWADPEPWRLAEMKVAWLWVEESRLSTETEERLEAMEGLERVYQEDGQSIWRVRPRGEEPPAPPTEILSLKSNDGPDGLTVREPYSLTVEVGAGQPGRLLLEFRYLARVEGEKIPANPDDLLRDAVALNEPQPSIDLIGPPYPGVYDLEWRQAGTSEWRPLATLTFSASP